MRVLFLPDWLTVVSFFVLWPTIQVGAALFCLYLPSRFFNSNRGIYKTQKFEQNGKWYEKVFKIKKWKHLLPDGGAISKKRGYAKKTLKDFSQDNLNKFLQESCRAELSHWVPILLSWVFLLITTPFAAFVMFVYSLLVNLPCILAQRYNRPRIQQLLQSKKYTQ